MGDVGDDFRAHNEQQKKRKWDNEKNIICMLMDAEIPFRDVGNSTVLIREEGFSMDIYTSKNKWKFEGNIIQGDAKGCMNFIKKRLSK